MTNHPFAPTKNLSDEQATMLRQYFTKREAAVVSFIRRLCEIESPTNDAEGSRAVVDLICREAEKIEKKVELETIESESVGTHLRATFFKDNAISVQPPALVLAHTDTVHERGSLAARPVRIEDGKLYAPGSFDMKANCALTLEAVRAFVELKLKPVRAVEILFTCDEETGSATSRLMIDEAARRAAYVLVVEPTGANGAAKTNRKGVGKWTIRARGIAAHAGLNPTAGASAILELAKQTQRLHQISNEAQTESLGINLNVGIITGGTRSNVVASDAMIKVDARFATPDEARRVERIFETLAPFDNRVKLNIEGGINRPPLERNEQVVALYIHAQKLAAQLGFDLPEVSVGGASDGNFVSALRVPVLDGMGLRGDGAHAAHEHILIDDIARRGSLLVSMIATL